MRSLPRTRKPRISVESLEGRALLSGFDSIFAELARSKAAIVQRIATSGVKVDTGAAAGIMSALGGGAGSEWATLIKRQVRNSQAVVRQFVSGQLTAYSTTGITFRTPHEQSQFTGQPYDQLLPLAAGGAVFRGNVLEFATILRGEFRDPNTSYYVFAVDRGAGASRGAVFASRPGITPDALVTITVGPYGSSASGQIQDLTDGSVQTIDPSRIAIRGATLRVFLDAGQLPTRGAQLNRYRFAMWTQTQPGSDIANVASFAPDASMIPIAVLKNVSVRR
ncbi:hypothetical protein [Paludisphaera rhizosphaerae]|uniref:hypothetical protein n=1 Tax=Paludisphaera rhizosphaerae TaxID=2711216 RepID=UPI0013EC2497|nr:hypothetical protein [Paludisphaera rhizosphaerae]